jgi:hypothetical protein
MLNRVVLVVAVLTTGCMGGPPIDNPTASPRSEQRGETRGLEKAESECASQGKHAEAQRVEGETVYTCVD